jgi:hypothetical protein
MTMVMLPSHVLGPKYERRWRPRNSQRFLLLVINAHQHHQDHLLVYAKPHTYGKKTIANFVQIIIFFLDLRATCVLNFPRVFQVLVYQWALKLVHVPKAICRCRKTLQEF